MSTYQKVKGKGDAHQIRCCCRLSFQVKYRAVADETAYDGTFQEDTMTLVHRRPATVEASVTFLICCPSGDDCNVRVSFVSRVTLVW